MPLIGIIFYSNVFFSCGRIKERGRKGTMVEGRGKEGKRKGKGRG